IDRRDGGPIEVVVVARNELAQLIDEEAEAEPGNDRSRSSDPLPEIAQQEKDTGDHQGAAPQHVRDMESTASEARIPGHAEEEAHPEEGCHRRHEEGLEQLTGIEIANEEQTRQG